MGISGLLPLLKEITHPTHVSEYRGHRVAVDAYCWLHRGAYSCSAELCEGQATNRYVDYCMRLVEMLRHHGVHPMVVFDGGRLPMKGKEEGSRAQNRKESLAKAQAHAAAGNRAAALECYQRAVDISPEALKAAGVDFVVAPYEADAQMAYLALGGAVHAVITEDSDLLPYGCPRVLFKMDKAGNGQQVCLEDLPRNRDPSFVGFTHDMFLEMCVMSGCDFLRGLSSIGVKKAHAHIRRLKSFVRVCKSLRFSGVTVPRGYEAAFQRALWTFRHQRVYCARARALVPLRPLPAGGLASCAQVPEAMPGCEEADLHFLGPRIPDEAACGIAVGELNPITLQPFVQLMPPRVLRALPLNCSAPGSLQGSRGKSKVKAAGVVKLAASSGIAAYFRLQPAADAAAQRDFTAPRAARRAGCNRDPASGATQGPAQAAGEAGSGASADIARSLSGLQAGPSSAPSGSLQPRGSGLKAGLAGTGVAEHKREALGAHGEPLGTGAPEPDMDPSPAERAAHRGAGYGSQPETSSCRKRGRVADPQLSQPRGAGKAGMFSRFRCGAGSQSQGSGGVSMEPSRGRNAAAQPRGTTGAPADAGQATEGSRAPSRKRARGARGCLPALAALGISHSGKRQHSPTSHGERRASVGAPGAQRRNRNGAKPNAVTASCTGAGMEQAPDQAHAGAGAAGGPAQGAEDGRAVSVCVREEWVVHEQRGGDKGWRTLAAGASRGPAGTPGTLGLEPTMGDGGLDALLDVREAAPESGSGLGSGQGVSDAAASSRPTLDASDQAASASGGSRAALEAALTRGGRSGGVAGPDGGANSSGERALAELLHRGASGCRSDVSAARLSLGGSSDAALSLEETGVLPGGAGAQAEFSRAGLPLAGLSDSRAEADTGSGDLGLSFGGAECVSLELGVRGGGSAGAPSETSLERALGLAPGRAAGLAAAGEWESPASGNLEHSLGLGKSPAPEALDGTLDAVLAKHTYPRGSGVIRSAQGGSGLGALGGFGLGFQMGAEPEFERAAPASRGRTPARLGLRGTPVCAGAPPGLNGSPLLLGDDVLLPPVGGRSVLASHRARRASPSSTDARSLPPTGLRSSGNRRRLRQAFYEGADIVAEADPESDPELDRELEDGALNEGCGPGCSPEGAPASTDGRSRARRQRSAQRVGRGGEPRASPGGSPAPKRPRRSARAAKRRRGSGGLHGRFNEVAGDAVDRVGPSPCAAERRHGRRRAQGGAGGEARRDPSERDPRDPTPGSDRALRPAACRGTWLRRSASAEHEAADELGPAAGASPGQSGGTGGARGPLGTSGGVGGRDGGAAEAAEDGGDNAGGGFASLRHVSLFEREARRAVGRVAASGAGRRAGQWLSGTAAAAQSALQRPFAPPRPRQCSARRTPQQPPARASAAGASPACGAATTRDRAPTCVPVPHDRASARASASPAAGGHASEPGARAPVQAAEPFAVPTRLKGRPGERPRTTPHGGPVREPMTLEAVQGAPAGGAGASSPPPSAGLFRQFMFAAQR